MSDQETVANMERVWQAIIALGSTLTEQEWKTPTDCPGWTVQDQVAHMLGSESRLLGLPVPDQAGELDDGCRATEHVEESHEGVALETGEPHDDRRADDHGGGDVAPKSHSGR